jgi:hypothetical protein
VDLDIEIVHIDARSRQITSVLAVPLYRNLRAFVERQGWRLAKEQWEAYRVLTEHFCLELNRTDEGFLFTGAPSFTVPELGEAFFNYHTDKAFLESFDPVYLAGVGKGIAREVQREIERVQRTLSPIKEYRLFLPPFQPPLLAGDSLDGLWLGRELILQRSRESS